MEEKKISEQESLELISQMINQTKQSLNKDNGNSFLIWGYVCSIVGLLVYALSMTSIGRNACWLYFAIPVAGGLLEFIAKRKRNSERFVKGYIESMICKCWKALSWIFIITLIVCMTNILLGYHVNLIIFFILGLLLPGIGTAFTGIAIRENLVAFGGFLGSAIGLSIMVSMLSGDTFTGTYVHLIFVACYVVMMVIPGHYLNSKYTR
ncbi:MAG: hypothetical protein K2H16_03495 [Prevotella sp.]|nr:hypothetical protein [Prevotella sp.]